MTVSVMLQVITVAITVGTLLSDTVYKLIINRRKRTFSIVVKDMMRKLDDFRDAYAQVMYLTDLKILNKYKEDNKKGSWFVSFYAYDLNFNRGRIRANSLPFWKKEVHLHAKMDELCKTVLNYYEKPKKDMVEKIAQLRDEFFVECSVYDWAIWEYIQTISSGKKVNRQDVDEQYYRVLTKIENSGSGRTLKFKEAFSTIYDYYKNSAPKQLTDKKEGK